ncbi:hypothetical protein APUTEX25_005267, partial [Auxenochlorella protothecoides]
QPTPHLGCDPGASYCYLEDVEINHIPWVASVCAQQGKLLPERANSFTQESCTVMGGASDLNVPKGIWSPAGGWYSDPKYWKRNTALAIGIIVAIAIPVFRTSVSKEQRYGEPQHDIPSQKWTPKENFHVAK